MGQQGLGRFLVQKQLKQLLPTSILRAAQGEGAGSISSLERSRAPKAQQFPAQNRAPGTATCPQSQHRDLAFPAAIPWWNSLWLSTELETELALPLGQLVPQGITRAKHLQQL